MWGFTALNNFGQDWIDCSWIASKCDFAIALQFEFLGENVENDFQHAICTGAVHSCIYRFSSSNYRELLYLYSEGVLKEEGISLKCSQCKVSRQRACGMDYVHHLANWCNKVDDSCFIHMREWNTSQPGFDLHESARVRIHWTVFGGRNSFVESNNQQI